jgi:hypothetical protein
MPSSSSLQGKELLFVRGRRVSSSPSSRPASERYRKSSTTGATLLARYVQKHRSLGRTGLLKEQFPKAGRRTYERGLRVNCGTLGLGKSKKASHQHHACHAQGDCDELIHRSFFHVSFSWRLRVGVRPAFPLYRHPAFLPAAAAQFRSAGLCRYAIATRKRACLPCRAFALLQEASHTRIHLQKAHTEPATDGEDFAEKESILCRMPHIPSPD